MRLPTAAKTRFMPIVSILAVAVGLLALAGCGGSSSTTSSSAATPSTPAATPTTSSGTTSSTPAPATANALSVEANAEGQLKYNKSSLTANAGKVSIAFTNTSPLEHNLTIATSSGTILGATPTFKGGTKLLALELKAGTYKFFCTVPGHRMAGMEGTLTVK